MSRRNAVLALLAAVLLAGGRPASAASTLEITSATLNGTRIAVKGQALLDQDVEGPHRVFEDPIADDFAEGSAPNGLDMVSGSISREPGGPLVFTIETANMPPVLDKSAPTFVFNWMVAVNGADEGFYVQAGFVGGWPDTTTFWYGGQALNAGPFFNVCQRVPQGIGCTSLGPNGGTIGGNRVTVRVPLLELAAKPGDVIEAGTAGGTDCAGVCSTWQPYVALLHNTGGDQAAPDPFVIPGGVQLAAVAADADEASVDWSRAVTAVISPNGGFAATFTPNPPLSQGDRIVARACGGNLLPAGCAHGSAPVT